MNIKLLVMKSNIKQLALLIAIMALATNYSYAQLKGFVLTPAGTTDIFMKYIPKIQQYNGTNYVTGFLTLSSYQVQLGASFDADSPVQKLQMQGGNILLCKTFNNLTPPDFNPTSKNGAILFSDVVTNTYINGKWGIEYESQYSSGGLNFFNPVSQLTTSRINFNLFLSNAGRVGIGIGDPSQKLDIDGNIRLRNNATIGTWSSNSLTFNTNSAARMVIAADGKVGVGITTPSEKLDIDGNIRLRNDATIGTWSNNSLTFNTNSAARMVILADGKIGVGITTPSEKLDIDGNIRLRNNATIGTWSSNSLTFNTNSAARMVILADGNVGIGVASPQHKLHVAGGAKFDNQVLIDAGGLYVNGEIKAKKYLATLTPFPDYVFLPEYKLLTINEVESFIAENGHLPGLPDAATVEINGIELGEMNALLLQKIEELTLYIIAQDKKIQTLETVVNTPK